MNDDKSTNYSVEGLRGIAALLVAIMHTWDNDVRQFNLIKNAWLFVDVFFVISGYVIASRYAFAPLNVKSFALRRIGRLYPLHVVMLFGYFIVQYLPSLAKAILIFAGFGHLFSTPLIFHPPDWQSLLMGLTFTDIFGWHHHWLNNPHWSVSAEIWTYVVFACFMFLPGARWKVFGVGALLSAVALFTRSPDLANVEANGMYVAISGETTANPWSLVRSTFGFFIGALVACAPKKKPNSALQLVLLFASVFSIVGAEYFGRFTYGQVFIFALLIWSLNTDEGFVASLLGARPFKKLGEWSYSIYISHAVVLLVFHAAADRAGAAYKNWLLIPYVVVLVMIAMMTYKWIERPFRDKVRTATGVIR